MSILATAGSTVPLVVDFGTANTGVAANLGYRIVDPFATTILARQSNPGAGIIETVAGSGIYIAQRTFLTTLQGALIWDITPPGTLFAQEDINIVPLTSLPGVVLGGVPVNVTVLDSVALTPLANVSVQVYLQSDTTFLNVIAIGFTNTLGQVSVFVPPNTPIKIRYVKSGYQELVVSFTSQNISQPPTVRVDSLTSILMVPSFPGAVVVFDNLIDDRGQPLSGIPVIARLNLKPGFVTSTGQLISPDFSETVTDSLGFWQLPLIPNPLITPSGTKYEIEVGKLEPRIRKTATVATSPSAQRFKDLVP